MQVHKHTRTNIYTHTFVFLIFHQILDIIINHQFDIECFIEFPNKKYQGDCLMFTAQTFPTTQVFILLFFIFFDQVHK